MSDSFRRRERCTLCTASGAQLQPVMSLASTPPANEFVREQELAVPQPAVPLTLLLCSSCGHVQLAEIVDPVRLFKNYVYVSGTSPVFVAHFKAYAERTSTRFGLDDSAFVVDVGSNDGTLLKQFQARGIRNVLGIDPAAEIARKATSAGIPTLEAFLTRPLAEELLGKHGPANLITANNVFAHAEDLIEFAQAVSVLLASQGVFIFEVSYLVDVVQKLLFDTIYHEHLSYHTLAPLKRFFESVGMRLFDAERVDTHGGSIRCYVCHGGARHHDTEQVKTLIEGEREGGFASAQVYQSFKSRISERGAKLRSRVAEIIGAGQRVAGFGAPAKLTTLMYEFGLDGRSIDFVVDDSPWKQGLYTPGTHIPVLSSPALIERKPGWCLIFAWNFAASIIDKQVAYRAGGGRFLVPLPELRET